MLARAFLAFALLICPTLAEAQLCGDTASQSADGRMLGHFPYGDVPAEDLGDTDPGFALNRCQLQRAVLPDLARLVADADGDPAARGTLRGLSCHRGIVRQGGVFCRDRPDADAATRAISVAPPGHSEHTTGYALDFAVRPANGCPDAEACMAATPMARWLTANAPRYGFELSFPPGNKQNVKWEPWHWRWVGTSAAEPGAARARTRFARARAAFPASPGVDTAFVIDRVDAPPVYLTLAPYKPCKGKRCRR